MQKEELSHYSNATTDFEYAFPFTEWGELWGVASRTDFDLTAHQTTSGKSIRPILIRRITPGIFLM